MLSLALHTIQRIFPSHLINNGIYDIDPTPALSNTHDKISTWNWISREFVDPHMQIFENQKKKYSDVPIDSNEKCCDQNHKKIDTKFLKEVFATTLEISE